jgi:hypothetical protein
MMALKVLAAVVAVLLGGNGLYMLLQPESWYQAVPSVPHTGPLNVHFVMDIGIAYLASAAGIAAGIWRPGWRVPAAIPALIFIGTHAALHLIEWGSGHPAALHETWVDRIGLYGPAIFLIVWMTARNGRQPC